MHRALPLVLLRATFLASLPWGVAAAQVVNLGDESVAPTGARGAWFLFALKIAAFFVLLAGLVVAVLWKGRRGGQQAQAAAAVEATPGGGAGATSARAPSDGLEVALDALPLPPRHHRWNLSYGLGGMVAGVGVVWVYTDLGAEWQLAVAGGAAGAWFVAAARDTMRVPVVSLRATSGDRAPVARGRAPPRTLAIALFPSAVAVFCWAVTMTDASRALLSFALLQPIVTWVDWGRTREAFQAGDDALERRSPWLRRATRVAWRDVTRVVVSRPSPHDVTLLVWARDGNAGGAERKRIAVPLALDGIGDLAAALSRRIPGSVWTASEPGTRALLDALAPPDREN